MDRESFGGEEVLGLPLVEREKKLGSGCDQGEDAIREKV